MPVSSRHWHYLNAGLIETLALLDAGLIETLALLECWSTNLSLFYLLSNLSPTIPQIVNAIPKTTPLIDIADKEEQKAPILQPSPHLAPYPINRPPRIEIKISLRFILDLKTKYPANRGAIIVSKIIPTLRIEPGCIKNPWSRIFTALAV
jgi:hypothetical protein